MNDWFVIARPSRPPNNKIVSIVTSIVGCTTDSVCTEYVQLRVPDSTSSSGSKRFTVQSDAFITHSFLIATGSVLGSHNVNGLTLIQKSISVPFHFEQKPARFLNRYTVSHQIHIII
jgi:hypothetical protein